MNRLFFACIALFGLCQFLVLPASFAEPFRMGVANASFQVEGHPADSDWYRWTHTSGKIQDGSNADLATDFWNRYEEDFKLARSLGANTFRISIAWERIEPSPGAFNLEALAHYAKMIASMRAYRLEPIVTLHHFVLPAWLAAEGGLLSPRFPEAFARYSALVVSKLARAPLSVKLWMTLNEPNIEIQSGYVEGSWPPGMKSPRAALKAYGALAVAHIEATRAIRALGIPGVRIGFAHHWRPFYPLTSSRADAKASQVADDFFNQQFVRALMTGKIRFSIPFLGRVSRDVPLPSGKPTLDYLGLNYYGRSLVQVKLRWPFLSFLSGNGPKSDLGWEVFAPGLYDSLVSASKYGLPLIVSENGIADRDDKLRARFIEEHLQQILKAKKAGIPVMGYLHWSLTDNFEWAMGLSPRFGLVRIDYATQRRIPRPSFSRFREMIGVWGKALSR